MSMTHHACVHVGSVSGARWSPWPGPQARVAMCPAVLTPSDTCRAAPRFCAINFDFASCTCKMWTAATRHSAISAAESALLCCVATEVMVRTPCLAGRDGTRRNLRVAHTAGRSIRHKTEDRDRSSRVRDGHMFEKGAAYGIISAPSSLGTWQSATE